MERVQIGIGHPQIPALPADAVRAVAGRRKHPLDDPGFGIDAIDVPRWRHGKPQLPLSPLLPMGSGPGRGPSQHFSHLIPSDLNAPSAGRGAAAVRAGSLRLRGPTTSGERTGSLWRVVYELVDHAGARREMSL